ncbi:ROK family protein [Cohnella sp. 56]|uniref:ROK family protein n=1 Tax=Cohnella sp. 56 TaxID=3113722 RepID=UPI0030EADDC4
MASTGNQQTIKKVNKSLLLSLIASRGPLSRVELSRLTRLSPSTVSILVDELRAERFVYETGTVSGSGAGRRMTMLNVKPDGGYVLGLDLAKSYAVLLDQSGETAHARDIPPLLGKQAIADRLPPIINSILSDTAITADRVRRIGISVPGRIDENGTHIVSAMPLQIDNWALAEWLEPMVGAPVRLINDLDAAGFAERSSGAAQGCRTIVYLLIGSTVGAGLVIDGRIYRGSTGRAGRVGDFARFSTLQLSARLQREYPHYFPGNLTPRDTLRRFAAIAPDADVRLRDEMEDIIGSISAYCGSLLQLLDPERLIIGGWLTEDKALFDRLIARIGQAEKALAKPCPVSAASWGDRGSAFGAATMGLHDVFKPVEL